jgi:O-antigen/teichoic acid export membrane protein
MTGRRYINGIFWSLSDKLIFLVTFFISTVMLAKYLGPGDFGIMVYSQSIVALFAFIATLGTDSTLVNKIVNNIQKKNEIVSVVFLLRLIVAFFLILFLNIIIRYVETNDDVILFVSVLSPGLLIYSFSSYVQYFYAIVDIKSINTAMIFGNIISLCLKFIGILTNQEVLFFVTIDVLLMLTLSASYFFIYINKKGDLSIFYFDINLAKFFVKESWPLIFTFGLIVAYFKIDQVMIGYLLSNEYVGVYATISRFVEVWTFIPIVLINVLFAALISSKKNSDVVYIERQQQLYFLFFWMAIFFSLFVYFFSENIIRYIFVDTDVQINEILFFSSLAGVLFSLGLVSNKWMIMEGMFIYEFFRGLSGIFTNIFLNIILIPIYGIKGASIATFVGLLVYSQVSLLFTKKTRKLLVIQNMALFQFQTIKQVVHLLKHTNIR